MELSKLCRVLMGDFHVEEFIGPDELMFLVTQCGLPRKFVKLLFSDVKEEMKSNAYNEMIKYFTKFWSMIENNKGLMFVGPVGTGKTTAMTMMLKYSFVFIRNEDILELLRQHFMGTLSYVEPVCFWESGQLVSDYFNDKHLFNERMDKPVLGIDDITKPSQDIYKEALDRVLRHRDINGLPTHLTSQVPLKELEEVFGTATTDIIRGNNIEVKIVGTSLR